MNCLRCNSERIIEVSAKCSDLCHTSSDTGETEGYVPGDLGIGGGDYIEFAHCLNCGQIQDEFPLPPAEIEG
jgi:hypothetical protein